MFCSCQLKGSPRRKSKRKWTKEIKCLVNWINDQKVQQTKFRSDRMRDRRGMCGEEKAGVALQTQLNTHVRKDRTVLKTREARLQGRSLSVCRQRSESQSDASIESTPVQRAPPVTRSPCNTTGPAALQDSAIWAPSPSYRPTASQRLWSDSALLD